MRLKLDSLIHEAECQHEKVIRIWPGTYGGNIWTGQWTTVKKRSVFSVGNTSNCFAESEVLFESRSASRRIFSGSSRSGIPALLDWCTEKRIEKKWRNGGEAMRRPSSWISVAMSTVRAAICCLAHFYRSKLLIYTWQGCTSAGSYPFGIPVQASLSWNACQRN